MEIGQSWQSSFDRRARRRICVDYLIESTGVVYGIVAATIAVCDMNANIEGGMLGWTLSTVSAVRLLSIRRRKMRSDEEPAPVGWRVGAALIAVFCALMVTIMLVVVVKAGWNWNELGREGVIACGVLTIVGVASTLAASSMILK